MDANIDVMYVHLIPSSEHERINLFEAMRQLRTQGYEVPKSVIRMPEGPLKQVGDQPVRIALHPDVVVTITVSVLGEQPS